MGHDRVPDRLDKAFSIGIFFKGLNGVLEIIGGTVLLFATPALVSRLLNDLTGGELAEDPTDLLATKLHQFMASDALTAGGLRFAAMYLLAHGVVKVVLVAAVLRGKSWAYPWMIGFLVTFITYQLSRILVAPSTPMIALTLFDIVLAGLAARQWRRHPRAN